MLRNNDPFRPGPRFLTRNQIQSLPATSPTIPFLNALQDELLNAFKFAGISNVTNDQLARSIERIRYGFWSFGNRHSYQDSVFEVQLKQGGSFSVPLQGLYRANIAGDTFQRIELETLNSPSSVGCLTIQKKENLLVIESSYDTSFSLFLEHGIVLRL